MDGVCVDAWGAGVESEVALVYLKQWHRLCSDLGSWRTWKLTRK
jgi:hypothetical protein